MRRTIGSIAAAIAVVAGVAGCSVQSASDEPLQTAIPAALLASDLGITEAEANPSVDGLAVTVFTAATFDRSTVTADDLREVLRIVVENTNFNDAFSVRVLGLDGSTEEYDTIDLGAVGEELGFETSASDPGDFVARWDDVVALVQK